MMFRRWCTLGVVLGGIAAVLIAGCSQSARENERLVSGNNDNGSFGVHLLQRPPALGRPALGDDGDLLATVEVDASAGGSIVVGNQSIGYSTLTIPPGALPNDATIAMEVPLSGLVEARFEPEGIQFLVPVEVELSYHGANLDDIDVSMLKVFYHNLDTDIWEPTEGIGADFEREVVRAQLTHFSQYAVGSED